MQDVSGGGQRMRTRTEEVSGVQMMVLRARGGGSRGRESEEEVGGRSRRGVRRRRYVGSN